MTALTLTVLANRFAVHRLAPDALIPETAQTAHPIWLGRAGTEISPVCPESAPVVADRTEAGWARFSVDGIPAFDRIGVLAGLADVLVPNKPPQRRDNQPVMAADPVTK